jgi:hypothetical protein
MFFIWIFTGMLATVGQWQPAINIWNWCGLHPFLTILLIIFFA